MPSKDWSRSTSGQWGTDIAAYGIPLDSWETLVVTLGNVGPEGKHLSMEKVKSSLLNEEACWKDKESISDRKALVIERDSNRGRGR